MKKTILALITILLPLSTHADWFDWIKNNKLSCGLGITSAFLATGLFFNNLALKKANQKNKKLSNTNEGLQKNLAKKDVSNPNPFREENQQSMKVELQNNETKNAIKAYEEAFKSIKEKSTESLEIEDGVVKIVVHTIGVGKSGKTNFIETLGNRVARIKNEHRSMQTTINALLKKNNQIICYHQNGVQIQTQKGKKFFLHEKINTKKTRGCPR
jgi:hypothetical protein